MTAKNQQQIDEGNAAENRFVRIMAANGCSVKESTKSENMYEHFDYRVYYNNDQYFSVDVKAMKRICRGDREVQDKYVWVEFENVNGAPGWLYGKAEFIAFEIKNGFAMVKRKDLIEYCESVVDMNTTVDYCRDALNKVYRRDKRQDSMTLLELALIPHTKIKEP